MTTDTQVGDRPKEDGFSVTHSEPPHPIRGEGEPIDRVMAVLNYWFDGSRRIDRNSEMVKQLAALAHPPTSYEPEGLREKVARIIDPIAFLFSPAELGVKDYHHPARIALGKADQILQALQSASGKPR